MGVQPLARLTVALISALALFAAAPSSVTAGVYTFTARIPVKAGPYQVLQSSDFKLPTPARDGRYSGTEEAAILRMSTEITDENGTPVAANRLMLHHIVFLNGGNPTAGRFLRDSTCDTLTFPDNQTTVPAAAERFYSAGEERSVFDLPLGYGYKVRGLDRWGMLYMVMNHRAFTDRAYIQYKVTYATGTEAKLTENVTPFWFDIENCRADPIYNVRGGGEPGSSDTRRFTWTAPESIRIVTGQGHVHGGARILRLRQLDCGDRIAAESTPTWGGPDHPFYNVRPILHEPGPINMTRFYSDRGIPVAKGQRIELEAVYDNQLPHTRVMATMLGAFRPDPSVTADEACGGLPPVRYRGTAEDGRAETPRFRVPLVEPPTGPFRRHDGGPLIVSGQRFTPRRLSMRVGDGIRWLFNTADGNDNLHDITVADGPEGFASPHLSEGRSFVKRFDVPGRYKLFCSLHPIAMTQEIEVRR